MSPIDHKKIVVQQPVLIFAEMNSPLRGAALEAIIDGARQRNMLAGAHRLADAIPDDGDVHSRDLQPTTTTTLCSGVGLALLEAARTEQDASQLVATGMARLIGYIAQRYCLQRRVTEDPFAVLQTYIDEYSFQAGEACRRLEDVHKATCVDPHFLSVVASPGSSGLDDDAELRATEAMVAQLRGVLDDCVGSADGGEGPPEEAAARKAAMAVAVTSTPWYVEARQKVEVAAALLDVIRPLRDFRRLMCRKPWRSVRPEQVREVLLEKVLPPLNTVGCYPEVQHVPFVLETTMECATIFRVLPIVEHLLITNLSASDALWAHLLDLKPERFQHKKTLAILECRTDDIAFDDLVFLVDANVPVRNKLLAEIEHRRALLVAAKAAELASPSMPNQKLPGGGVDATKKGAQPGGAQDDDGPSARSGKPGGGRSGAVRVAM